MGCNEKTGESRSGCFLWSLLQEVDVIDVGEHVDGPPRRSDKSSLHCCSWNSGEISGALGVLPCATGRARTLGNVEASPCAADCSVSQPR